VGYFSATIGKPLMAMGRSLIAGECKSKQKYCIAERYDGIGFAGPFHPEVTLQAKTKNAAWAAFNVFYTTGLCQQAVNATCIKY